jgi:predicted RNA-binding protein with PIN domain
MHIIIDGYNLIRQSDALRQAERTSLEEGRKALIRRLASYRRSRGHRISVVFDGWQNGPYSEERDREQGVDILYSCRGERADELIKRMISATGEEIVVITSDRGIADFAERRGYTAIPSPTFERRMEEAGVSGDSREGDSDVDDGEDRDGRKKKGSAHRLPKRKRAALAKLKKL